MENLRARSDQYDANDEVVRYNERYEEHVRTSERTVPAPRERVSQEKIGYRSVNDESDLINKQIRLKKQFVSWFFKIVRDSMEKIGSERDFFSRVIRSQWTKSFVSRNLYSRKYAVFRSILFVIAFRTLVPR